jgi:DivIVA domain-containing protein
MALDRQSIEKKDFPIGRRGYEPDAVDAHLAAVAAEVERLRTEPRRGTDSLSSQASEQVRMIIEAAEQSAAEITRQAEAEAGAIRGEADLEAQAICQEASRQADDHLAQVRASSAGMVERVDALESELTTLVETLRTSAHKLNADLVLLEGGASELRGASRASTGLGAQPRDARPEHEGLGGARDDVAAASGPGVPVAAGDGPEPGSADEGLTGPGSEYGAEVDDGDAEGARLVALNMALNGTPRDETDRYLAENYALADRDGLLDEVYATVGP